MFMGGGGAGQAVKMVSATEPAGQKTHFLLQAEHNQISIVIDSGKIVLLNSYWCSTGSINRFGCM